MDITYRRGLGHRLLCRAFDLPDRVVQKIAGDPVELDGRVLNRSVQFMLALTQRADPTGLNNGSVQERRSEMRRATPLAMPVATDLHVTERIIPGPEADLRLRIYRTFAPHYQRRNPLHHRWIRTGRRQYTVHGST